VPAANAGLRPPSAYQLKFLGLTVRKIWHILCVCVSRSVTLTFDLLTLKLVCMSHQRWGPSFQIWARLTFGFSNYLLRTRRTDGETAKSNAYCLLPYGRRHNKALIKMTLCNNRCGGTHARRPTVHSQTVLD